MIRAFLYGTLRDDTLRRIVLGRDVATESARLPAVSARTARGGDWPTLVAGGGAAPGLLTEPLSSGELGRLDWYERTYGCRRDTVRVDGADVCLWRGETDATDAIWDFAGWQARWAAMTRIAAAEAMGHRDAHAPEWVAARWTQIRQRAASRVRAATAPAPILARSGLEAGDVEVVEERRPYTDYFSLIEQDLRFRRQDGRMSDAVARAALVAGDAVTVLPYDPAEDTVLLVEQFRFGPWTRGDPRPWTLEPIAGRIDPGEDAETTGRREAMEEANVEIARLERVAAFYPTTGAMSEYIYAFIGICSLSGQAGTVAGTADEHEDILSHVVSFGHLTDLVAAGEVENGPLLLSTLWLAANRDRLRSG